MRRSAIALLCAAALLGAACGDDDVVVVEDDEPDVVEDVDPEVDCVDLTATEGAPIPLTLADTFFDPACFSMSSTQGITLANSGEAIHNFSIEGTSFDVDVQPGNQVEAEPIGDVVEFGTYDFFCKYHVDEGMAGVLTVE